MIPRRLLLFLLPVIFAPADSSAQPNASGAIIVSGDLTREFSLQSGGSAEGRILLHNPGSTPSRARIYQTDYQVDANGPVYGDAGQSPRSNARWIEIDEREPELQPGETRSILFKITAPADSTLRGTYWSMLMVEPFLDERPHKPGEISVRAVVRYGIQVVSQLGSSSAVTQPGLSNQTIERSNGKNILRFDLSNSGERLLRPRLEVRLFDHEGRAIITLPPGHTRVYPGSSVRQRFPLTGLPPGEYLALIVMDTDDALFGAQYRFQLED
ncbi:MAG: hypothetical protein QM760_08225 [Nibricoccus sp.]